MKLDALHRTSLRRTLFAVLLACVLLGGLAQALMTWRTAQAAVNAAFDRSLYGAIRAIDVNVSTESGGLGVELTYVLFEFFELTASGPVHYRIATEDGLVEIGSPDLPMPAQRLPDRVPHFATVDYGGSPTRVATYVRSINEPLAGSQERRLVIQVAEALASRAEFSRQFIIDAMTRDVLLALLGGFMVALAVNWSLRPLQQLRRDVQARAPDDLSPVDTARVPADVLPLVEAMNQHVMRHRELLAKQRRFLDDASHQLRTPLATLLTQLGFAQRERDNDVVRNTLGSMRQQLQHTIRQTNQMLALARADTFALTARPSDLVALARALTRHWWPAARGRDIDLGFEAEGAARPVPVQPELIEEALSNLIDNALRHAPAGGQVTVKVEHLPQRVVLHVSDSGPGIPDAELPQMGLRFHRASNAVGQGSGLGLAIVASIAERHGGQLVLAHAPALGGLWARIELPAAAAVNDQTAAA